MKRMALVSLMLAGCVFESPRPQPEAPGAAELRLTEAAIRAETALTTLARIEAVEHPHAAADIPRIVPPELLRRTTLDWTGPLPALAVALAARAEYRLVEAGAPPPLQPIIVIHAEEQPLILLLRDAGVQARTAAVLTVDPDNRTIRLEWDGTDA